MYHFILLTCFLTIGFSWQSYGQLYDDPENHQCLKCHSNQTYTFHNNLMDTEEKRLMNPFFIIDTTAIKIGVHKYFDCVDCHSYEYAIYPHGSNLKLEPLLTCLDCHGGDETFATYQFEKIDEEVKKSIHYEVYNENFTCSKCHSQHTYTTTARTSDNILEIVNYSNRMCLSCHNDMKKYLLISEHSNPELVEVHNWLPNQKLHFDHVRCIECHTEVIDGLMVSHNIQGKDKAVRNCVECHTADSRLKASLYKYQNLQGRSKDSAISSMISNDSYIIGMQGSPFLKLLSIIIFLATIAGVIVHLTFRIIKKK